MHDGPLLIADREALRGLSVSGRRSLVPLHPTVLKEEDVQLQIVQGLRAHGFVCLQTNLAKGRVVCDRGVPDILVSRLGYPRALWAGLEIKTASGRPTSEQRTLLELGRISIVRDLDGALEALRDFEAQWRTL